MHLAFRLIIQPAPLILNSKQPQLIRKMTTKNPLSARRFAAGCILCSALLAPALQAATVLNFPDFSSVAGLQLNGNAAQVGSVLRVTPSTATQSGSVFSTTAVTLTPAVSFSTAFSFRMSNPGGISDEDGQGADGIVFAVQTVANTAGGAGGGIGYSGLLNSVGVEFDSWNNGAGLGDPNGNHVAINTNGNLGAPLDADAVTDGRLNNGSIWYAWVDYNGVSDLLEVRLSTTSSRPLSALSSTTVDLTSVLGSTDAYVGFTSGTGAAFNDHDILSWEFRDDYSPIRTPEGGSTLVTLGIGLSVLGFASRLSQKRRRNAATN